MCNQTSRSRVDRSVISTTADQSGLRAFFVIFYNVVSI